MLGTALCAAIVAVEAVVLVVVGGGGSTKGSDVHVASAVSTTVPFEQPRSVVSSVQAPVAPAPNTDVPGPAQAPAPAPAPAPTAPAAAPASAPVADPIPACQPSDVSAKAATDHANYPQNGTVNATGSITNTSGHDCSAPAYVEYLWCDGSASSCISSAGPINPNATPEIWRAGATRAAADVWQFGSGPGQYTPHPGTGHVKFTWHLSENGGVAAATASFAIDGPPPASTTSVPAPTSTTVP